MFSTRTIKALVVLAGLLPGFLHAATLTLNPTADAYVQAGSNASKNYGSTADLRVQTNGTTSKNYDSYLKFDTTAATGQIVSAKLRVYAKLSAKGTVSTTAYAVATTTWGETSITWNNKPARGSALGSATVNSTSYAWKEIDVTPYVQSEFNAGRKVLSFAYHNSANSSPYITAYSRNSTNANKPQLVLTTNSVPTVSVTGPGNGSVFASPANINLTATASDSDGTIAKVEYFNGATLIATGGAAPSFAATWSNVTSGSYTLTAKATDNLGAATTSAPVSIIVNAPATIAIATPSNGQVFAAPANISLTATAADSDGTVQKVEYFNGATLIGSSTGPSPFSVPWNGVASGSYTLTAKVTDNQGIVTASNPVSITVDSLPTVSLASPAPGGTYVAPAAISFSATASDSDGTIQKVEYYAGSTLVATGTQAPNYTASWNAPQGTHSLTAKAYDNLGLSASSGAVSITVNPNIPPNVALTGPTNGQSFPAPAEITLTATANDSDGSIAQVAFYNGASLLHTATAEPYSYTWSAVPAGSYTLTAKAVDDKGAEMVSNAASVTVAVQSVTPGIYYLYADHLNTPRVITDSSNKVVWQWESDPFGTDLPVEGVTASGAKFGYNLRFPGQYFDKETGLHYNYFRDYDPSTGRYVESDPIGLEGGGFSTYAYVGGNPISNFDPLGLDPYPQCAGDDFVCRAGLGNGPIKPPNATVNFGVGGGGVANGLAGSAECGFTVNTATGKICTYYQICVGVGLGQFAGAGYTAGIQPGDVRPGKQKQNVVAGMGGRGPAAEAQIQLNENGSLGGAARGLLGMGSGAAVAAMQCTTTYLTCW